MSRAVFEDLVLTYRKGELCSESMEYGKLEGSMVGWFHLKAQPRSACVLITWSGVWPSRPFPTQAAGSCWLLWTSLWRHTQLVTVLLSLQLLVFLVPHSEVTEFGMTFSTKPGILNQNFKIEPLPKFLGKIKYDARFLIWKCSPQFKKTVYPFVLSVDFTPKYHTCLAGAASWRGRSGEAVSCW